MPYGQNLKNCTYRTLQSDGLPICLNGQDLQNLAYRTLQSHGLPMCPMLKISRILHTEHCRVMGCHFNQWSRSLESCIQNTAESQVANSTDGQDLQNFAYRTLQSHGLPICPMLKICRILHIEHSKVIQNVGR